MPNDQNKIKALNVFLDPEGKKKLQIEYNPATDTYEVNDKRFYVFTPAETSAKYREVAVKAWDQGITRFLEGSHVFPEEYITDYSYFVEDANKKGVTLKVSDNPLYWWVKDWMKRNSPQSLSVFEDMGGEEREEGSKDEEDAISQIDLDEINYNHQSKEEDSKENQNEVSENYETSLELKKVLHRLFRSGEVGFDRKGFFDAVVNETDPGLLLGKDNLTHQIAYDGKVYKIFYV